MSYVEVNGQEHAQCDVCRKYRTRPMRIIDDPIFYCYGKGIHICNFCMTRKPESKMVKDIRKWRGR